MICKYHKSWGCTAPARPDGYCLPHGVLFYWLVQAEGDPAARLREHDAVAGQPSNELEETLRGAVWAPRITAVLTTS